jgi:hypothetical protein
MQKSNLRRKLVYARKTRLRQKNQITPEKPDYAANWTFAYIFYWKVWTITPEKPDYARKT